MDRRIVKPERTQWRDLALSARHRQWGWDCPAVDIDFLLIEYCYSEPAALIEYKKENAPEPMPDNQSYRALTTLGNRAELPVFLVRYTPDFAKFTVVTLNQKARDVLPLTTDMTERQYVDFLYSLRGLPLPENLFNA